MLQINNDYDYEFLTHVTGLSLLALVDDWHDLISRSSLDHSPFQTPEWCMTWFAINPDTKPVFVTLRQEGKLIFLAPLMQGKSLPGCRTLSFFSHSDSKYGSVVWDRDHDGKALFEDFVSYLQDEAICDLLELKDIGETQPWIGDFHAMQRPSELDYASIVKTPPADSGDYIETLSKTMRRDVRLAIRKLGEVGEITFEVVPCDEKWLIEVFPEMLDWKKQWLMQRGRWGNGIFDRSFENLVTNLVKTGPCGSLKMQSCILWVNGKLLSADIHFIQSDTAFGYFSSFDTSYSKISPGTLRDYYMIEWLAKNGIQYFDLLGYPELYKDRLADIDLKLVNLNIPLNFKGKIANRLGRFNIRQAAKNFYYLIPAPWRKRAVGLLRGQRR